MATAYVSSHDGLPEPLCAVYEPASYEIIKQFLNQGIQCPRKIMIKSQNVLLLLQKDIQQLNNVNTPEELAQALQLIKNSNNLLNRGG